MEVLILLATDQAISTPDTLKALGLLGLAAFVGPLAIGGLLYILKKRESSL